MLAGHVRMLVLLDVLGLLDKVAAFFVAYYACSFKLWSDTVSWLDLFPLWKFYVS